MKILAEQPHISGVFLQDLFSSLPVESQVVWNSSLLVDMSW